MIDRCGALALPKGSALPADWPKPELDVPAQEAAEWRNRGRLPYDGRPVVALAPGAVGPSKRWSYFPELAQKLTAQGFAVWVLGSPAEAPLAAEIAGAAGPAARDLTSNDLSQCRPGAEVCRRLRIERLRPRPRRRRHGDADRRIFGPTSRGTGRRSIRSPRSSKR